MSENIIGIVVLPSGEKCIPIPSVPPLFNMYEFDEEDMPKLFVGIIAVSLFVTALGAFFLWDDLFGEQDTEVYYEFTSVEGEFYMGQSWRKATVHFSEPIGYENKVMMISDINNAGSSITWFSDYGGWARLRIPSGQEGEAITTDDLYFSCDGFKFIAKS